MKNQIFSAGIILLIFGCASGPDDGKKLVISDISESDTLSYPFKASYSSSFGPGDPKFAVIVLNGIKNYDLNQFEKSTDAFADSVAFDVPGGPVFHGTRAEVVARIRNYRMTLVSSES
ncbi:MAG: hypothetical protein ACHQET_12875, partial [Chitinophagales bacterium]